MSKNLGPIHYMMYDKIKFQDDITAYLLGDKIEEAEIIEKPVARGSLDSLIDQDNIHGWLDSKIDIVEKRLAYALAHADSAKKKMYDFGKEQAEGKDFSNFNTIFNDLNMYLLDGMPCDRGLSAQVDEAGDLYLITNANMHEKYEDMDINPEESRDNTCAGGHDHDHHDSFEVKSDSKLDLSGKKSSYHDYRYEFLKGYFENSPYDVEMINGVNFRIYQQ